MGSHFGFTNKWADRLKLLYWDGDGLARWYKSLEAGTVRFPQPKGNADRLEISWADQTLTISGIDLANVNRRERYRPNSTRKKLPKS